MFCCVALSSEKSKHNLSVWTSCLFMIMTVFFFMFFVCFLQGRYPPLLAACASVEANVEVVKALLAHPKIDVNKPMEVRPLQNSVLYFILFHVYWLWLLHLYLFCFEIFVAEISLIFNCNFHTGRRLYGAADGVQFQPHRYCAGDVWNVRHCRCRRCLPGIYLMRIWLSFEVFFFMCAIIAVIFSTIIVWKGQVAFIIRFSSHFPAFLFSLPRLTRQAVDADDFNSIVNKDIQELLRDYRARQNRS